MRELARGGMRSIGLYGASELAEIAVLRAPEEGLQVVCVCDPNHPGPSFLGARIVRAPEQASGVEAWVGTDLGDPHASLNALQAVAGETHVVAPDILGLGGAAGQA